MLKLPREGLAKAVTGSVVIDTSAGTLYTADPGMVWPLVRLKTRSCKPLVWTTPTRLHLYLRQYNCRPVIVQIKGTNSLELATRNHGDITVETDLSLTVCLIPPGPARGSVSQAPPVRSGYDSGAGGTYGGPGEAMILWAPLGDAKLAGSWVVPAVPQRFQVAGGGGAVSLRAHGTGKVTIGEMPTHGTGDSRSRWRFVWAANTH